MTMRSLTFLILYFIFNNAVALAQVKMLDVFKQMPDSLFPYLTANMRLDLIDFVESGMKAEVTNELGGKSRLTKLTDNYASIALTEASELEMRLLETEEAVDDAHQIICLVTTFGSGIRESRVDFYTVNWKQLPTDNYIILPSAMYRLSLSEHDNTLNILPECRLDYPANEEQKEIIKSSKKLNWDTQKFK